MAEQQLVKSSETMLWVTPSLAHTITPDWRFRSVTS